MIKKKKKRKNPATSHPPPPLFLALLLCITKHGSCERVGVEWLDFGANAPELVFLLPGSLFAPSSLPDNTLSKHTGKCGEDFVI